MAVLEVEPDLAADPVVEPVLEAEAEVEKLLEVAEPIDVATLVDEDVDDEVPLFFLMSVSSSPTEPSTPLMYFQLATLSLWKVI